MSKVSVIIPVYNVADYVEACLRSVMVQTYTDLEILICDDGSTDGSGEICDHLAREDARIRVIHTENHGLSAARNACLDMATGEYVAPVDSDDLVADTYIERLVHACEEQKADVAICDYRRIDESENSIEPVPNDSDADTEVYSNTEWLAHIYHPTSSGMGIVAWAKMYRRSLFEDSHIRYPVGKLHEDLFTTWKLLYAAQRIAYVRLPLYGYRMRQGSIMRKVFRLEQTVIPEATREQCDCFLQHNERELAALAVNNHFRMGFSVVANLQELGTAEAQGRERHILQQLRTDCRRYLPQAALPWYKKITFYIAAACPLQPLIQRLRMF